LVVLFLLLGSIPLINIKLVLQLNFPVFELPLLEGFLCISKFSNLFAVFVSYNLCEIVSDLLIEDLFLADVEKVVHLRPQKWFKVDFSLKFASDAFEFVVNKSALEEHLDELVDLRAKDLHLLAYCRFLCDTGLEVYQ
jgi:hypothetical protein